MLTRRRVQRSTVKGSSTVGAVSPVLLLALALTMAAQAGRAQNTTVNDLLLPDDAAPYSEQIYRVPCDNTRNETTFDFATRV